MNIYFEGQQALVVFFPSRSYFCLNRFPWQKAGPTNPKVQCYFMWVCCWSRRGLWLAVHAQKWNLSMSWAVSQRALCWRVSEPRYLSSQTLTSSIGNLYSLSYKRLTPSPYRLLTCFSRPRTRCWTSTGPRITIRTFFTSISISCSSYVHIFSVTMYLGALSHYFAKSSQMPI